ncbi:MAG: alpha/beta hydrolase [Pseudomonadota bacterium]
MTIPIAEVCAGSGPDIVLLHGVGLQRASWDQQLSCLGQYGRVHALDLPGHGQSPALACDTPHLNDYIASVQGYVSRHTQGPVVLIGHSLGALLAVSIAAKAPECCQGLVAITPVFERNEESARAVQRRASQLLSLSGQEHINEPVERWFGGSPTPANEPFAAACKNWLAQMDLHAYQRAYQVFALSRGPSHKDLSAIRCPALYVTGTNDRNSTPEMSAAMAAATPVGSYKVIDDAAHMLQLTHAQQLNEILVGFMSTLPAAVRTKGSSLSYE